MKQEFKMITPGDDTGIPLTYFDDCADVSAKEWLIKNVIARGETSSWIGAPGMGKSGLLTDAAVKGAAQSEWRGYRIKARFGVVYFALERSMLVRRRLAAYRLRDNLHGLPIAVAGQIIDLMDKNCADAIVRAVLQAEQRFGVEVGLAIIDSYSKGIAAGGGDEDRAKDQNIVAANMRRVLDKVNIHIAGIGHTGKDETRGERGSNARLADVDLLVHITGDTTKSAIIKKGNDQDGGVLTGFRLDPFDFGTDSDGDKIRTFILSDEILKGAPTERKLTAKQTLAMEALTEVELNSGQTAPAEFELPASVRLMPLEGWRQELLRRNVIDREGTNPRARFMELCTGLQGHRLIAIRDNMVWKKHASI